MLFGNASLYDDVVSMTRFFHRVSWRLSAAPRHGAAGLLARAKAEGRALTCSALKPQGLTVEELAALLTVLRLAGSIH